MTKKKSLLKTPERNNDRCQNVTNRSKSYYRSVFQEAEEFLVHCHLIFLYADLRLLSATGRLNTKFETLYIESDKVQKFHSSTLSGTSDPMLTDHLLGISPAQIMAILMIELRKEVQHNKEGGNKAKQYTEKSFLSILTNSSSRKKHEEDMASRLLFYNRMIGKDLKEKIEPHIISPPRLDRKCLSASTLIESTHFSLAPKSRNEIHTQSNGDSTTFHENETPPLNQRPQKRMGSFFNQMFNSSSDFEKRKALSLSWTENVAIDSNGIQNYINSNYKKEHTQPGQDNNILLDERNKKKDHEHRMQQLKKSFQRLQYGPDAEELFLRQEAQNVGDAFFDLAKGGIVEDVDKAMTEDEVLDMIQKAVDSRLDHSLDFMSGFFKEGSMCEAMYKSTANVFWINDWYPLIDCTYAIAVDPDVKRVLVVFRGAITTADWKHTRDFNFLKAPNPIEEYFKGKKDFVTFHSGFYNYIFRKRKDTNTTKYDEIVNKVIELVAMLGEDSVEIVVTGFSLGAALATIFGFYGSADSRLKKKGPIKMYTYGSPYVGGPSFAKSFRHQELNNKIRYANFFNPDDSVTHLPFNFKGNFQHVGIRVMLPVLRRPLRKHILGQSHPTVSYATNFNRFPRYIRAMRQSIFLNCIFPWEIKKKHALNMHHKRMVYFRESSLDGDLSEKSIEDLYQEIVFKCNNDRNQHQEASLEDS